MNPIGYLIVVIGQYTSIYFLLGLLASLAPMPIAFFFYAISINKDWKRDLRALKKMAKGKQSDAELSKVLSEFIRSHSHVKQLSGSY